MRRSPRQSDEPSADIRPGVALRPEPATPIDEHSVAVDPQHAPLDVVGVADDEVVAWADVAHSLKGTGPTRAVMLGSIRGPTNPFQPALLEEQHVPW